MRLTRRFWILGALIIAALASAPMGPAAGQTLGIAAVVNDEVISVHDLESRMDLLIATSNMPPTPETRQRLDSHVLRLLIEEALKMQEARRLNISVSREELAGALERIAGQVGVPPERMSEALASRGTDIQALIDQVEAEIAWVKTVQARTGGELTVDDEEVTARLQQLESRAGEPEVRVAEIFLPVSDPAQENEIQALMQRLVDQLAEGVSFRSLARNFSQGPTAAAGGDLGWMELDQFDPELQEVLADLPQGQAYGPVRTALGYYIVFMIDRRVVQPPPGRGRSDADGHEPQLSACLPALLDAAQRQVDDHARGEAEHERVDCGTGDHPDSSLFLTCTTFSTVACTSPSSPTRSPTWLMATSG